MEIDEMECVVAIKNLVGAISDKWESFSKSTAQHF